MLLTFRKERERGKGERGEERGERGEERGRREIGCMHVR
jgi:hypothetical protein